MSVASPSSKPSPSRFSKLLTAIKNEIVVVAAVLAAIATTVDLTALPPGPLRTVLAIAFPIAAGIVARGHVVPLSKLIPPVS